MKIVSPSTEDERDNLLRERVLANRINDVVADPASKRYRNYLHSVQSGFLDEPETDPNEQYREQAKALLPRALEAYEILECNEVSVASGRIYVMDDFPIAAAPDGIEIPRQGDEIIGITVHIRQSLETYREAVARPTTPDMHRHALAMMAVTGMQYWLHLEYFEDAETKMRKVNADRLLTLDRVRAEQLLDDLRAFAAKSRFQAADQVRETA